MPVQSDVFLVNILQKCTSRHNTNVTVGVNETDAQRHLLLIVAVDFVIVVVETDNDTFQLTAGLFVIIYMQEFSL